MNAGQAKPVIQQVIDILYDRIRSGEYQQSGKLPPESQLARQLSVSRTTLRTALARLESDGIISRRQGNGTFINKHVMEVSSSIGEIWDFRCMIEESGRKPSIQNLGLTTRPATPIETSTLNLATDEMVLEMLRLYLADGDPVIYSNNVFPCSMLLPECSADSIDITLPIHVLLKTYFNQSIAYSITDLSAGIPDDSLTDTLGILSGCPLLHFHDIFYNEKDEPLLFGRNFYNDKRLRIRMARSWG